MINAMGVGWSYVLLAGLCVLVSPIVLVIVRMGPRWRAKERERLAQHEAEKAAAAKVADEKTGH